MGRKRSDHDFRNSPLEQYPPIYFDMGGKDKYGFNIGYGIFKSVLDQRGIPYTTVFEPEANHDMWKRHAADSIRFVIDHTTDSASAVNATGVQ